MEEDKVFNINNDVVVSVNISNAPVEGSDSDDSEVEEVCITDPILGGGFLDGLEADLDGYNGYETPVNDLNEQEQAFCDQYDICLNSHRRKSFVGYL
ncbi:hypothetical protein Tco_1062167 [Tanacetum coccineum]